MTEHEIEHEEIAAPPVHEKNSETVTWSMSVGLGGLTMTGSTTKTSELDE